MKCPTNNTGRWALLIKGPQAKKDHPQEGAKEKRTHPAHREAIVCESPKMVPCLPLEITGTHPPWRSKPAKQATCEKASWAPYEDRQHPAHPKCSDNGGEDRNTPAREGKSPRNKTKNSKNPIPNPRPRFQTAADSKTKKARSGPLTNESRSRC